MPTYEYVCSKCDHEFEAFQSMLDEPLKSCPACKKRAVKRKIGGGAGLIFKGTGFYITDYKNQKPGKGEGSGGESKGGGDSKAGGETKGGETGAGTKTESKPAAAKSDAKPTAASKT